VTGTVYRADVAAASERAQAEAIGRSRAVLVIDGSFDRADLDGLKGALEAEAAYGVSLIYLTDGPLALPTPHISQVLGWLRELEDELGPPSICVTTFEVWSRERCSRFAALTEEGFGRVLASQDLLRAIGPKG
jgi:hypothetical protein